MKILKLSCCIAFTFFIYHSVHAQSWASYQSQQQVNGLVDTGDELFLATDAGLIVMNKATLEKTIFNKANSNLRNNHIQTIAKGPDGNTWVGTYDVVLYRFDGTGFYDITIPEADALNQNTVLYDLEIAPNGDLWLGTSDGILHRQGQNWLHYDDEVGVFFSAAWDIEINNEGEVFVASHQIFKYADGVWSNISEGTPLFAYSDRAEIFLSNSGSLFFAGDNTKVGRYDGENWQVFNTGAPTHFDATIHGHEVIGFAEDGEGAIYLNAQSNGVFKLEDGAWSQQADVQTEAFNNRTSFFYIDDQNNRWLNNGIYLSVNRNGSIQSTRISEYGIENNKVQKIQKGDNGYMCFITSTYSDSIAVLAPDGNWSSFAMPVNSVLWEGHRGDILYQDENDIWIASFEGLYHYNGNEWQFYSMLFCTSIVTDAQGKAFVRAFNGIYIVEDGGISVYNTSNSPIANGLISGHGVDASGNLWIASANEGVIQKVSPNGAWATFTGADHPAIRRPAGDFHFDRDGNVWVPDDVAGAIKFDGETWTNPIVENSSEITNLSVYSIESDEAGKVYFSHEFGITTLFENEWENLVIEEVPFNDSYSSSIKLDDNGTLWWGSGHYGVFAYSPETPSAVFSNTEISTGLSVYPNPADDYFVLDFRVEVTAVVSARIYNTAGQMVLSKALGQFPAGAFQQTIDLEGLPKGIYSIQLKANESFSSKRLVIH